MRRLGNIIVGAIAFGAVGCASEEPRLQRTQAALTLPEWLEPGDWMCEDDLFTPVPAPFSGLGPTAPVGTVVHQSEPLTFDLANLAMNSLRAMTGTVDQESCDNPENLYQSYFTTNFDFDPPFLQHESGSDDNLGKFVAPLALNSLIAGDVGVSSIHQHILNRYLTRFNTGMNGASSCAYEGFIVNYFRDHKPAWKIYALEAARRMVEDLIVDEDNDWAYYPTDSPWNFNTAQEHWKEEVLLMAYKNFGYAPALNAVRQHIRWARFATGVFDPQEGSFTGDSEEHMPSFHNTALYLQPFLNYAVLVNDTELLSFVNKSFLWATAKEQGSLPEIGFFPEFIGRPENGEACGISDMINTAMQLTQSSLGVDYWDQVDTWTRNHFMEAQLSDSQSECMASFASGQPEGLPDDANPDGVSYTFPAERTVGAFAGFPTPNSYKVEGQDNATQSCCTGNSSRTIYYVWNNIATQKSLPNGGKQLDVNLLMKKYSPDVDVVSFLPYQGRVQIKPKRNFNVVRVRIPRKATSGVTVTVAGNSRQFAVEGGFINLGSVSANQTVVVNFPHAKRNVTVNANGTQLNLVMRGNTVVSLTPGGTICPMYGGRAGYLATTAPVGPVDRFVTSEGDPFAQKDDTWELPIVNIFGNGTSDHPPTKLLDGDYDSWWNTSHLGGTATVDLGRSYLVSYVNLGVTNEGTENGREQRFDLAVSSNNQDFVTVAEGLRGFRGVTETVAFDIPDVNARYVRIINRGTDLGEEGSYFNEFRVWGKGIGPETTFSISASAASRSETNTAPSKTWDERFDTRWSAPDIGDWVEYKLSATKSVTKIALATYRGNERTQYFDIFAKPKSSADYVLLYRGESRGTIALETFDVPDIAAQYIRIVGRGNSQTTQVGFTEVRLIGY